MNTNAIETNAFAERLTALKVPASRAWMHWYDYAADLEVKLNHWKSLHDHSWSDGAMIKVPGESWQLEYCPCGATRQKEGSLVIE